jgi:hypothetical protein
MLSSLFLVTTSRAQEPLMDREISLGEVTPTPEMWLYQQEYKRYMNPRLAIRRKEEAKMHERQNRLASSRFYGYSKARPMASPTPFNSPYSTQWVGNAGDTFSYTPTPQFRQAGRVYSSQIYFPGSGITQRGAYNLW